jgi:tRNA (cytidine/uridine-2'-O-)-methyltransferase
VDPFFHVVLVQPQIPPNTGNIGRLCLATKCRLHLVGPLGFDLSEKAVRRAGLDYWKHVDKIVYESYEQFKSLLPIKARTWFFSADGTQSIFEGDFKLGDFFIFGTETIGKDADLFFDQDPKKFLQLPLYSEKVRSLNLANTASIVVYEGIRQNQATISALLAKI